MNQTTAVAPKQVSTLQTNDSNSYEGGRRIKNEDIMAIIKDDDSSFDHSTIQKLLHDWIKLNYLRNWNNK